MSLLAKLQPWLKECDGVTISGGEPFDQPVALAGLIPALRTLCDGDLLIYSGYSWNKLLKEHSDLIELADTIVSEPFIAAKQSNESLVGSTNQQVHMLNALSESRYKAWQEFKPAFGIAERDGVVYLAGIPRRGELNNIVQELQQGGWKACLTNADI
jgi:anaerobic ribonucleoside-triphosphate reductase activating protein